MDLQATIAKWHHQKELEPAEQAELIRAGQELMSLAASMRQKVETDRARIQAAVTRWRGGDRLSKGDITVLVDAAEELLRVRRQGRGGVDPRRQRPL